ncbi:MAG: hypothetical protein ACM369_09635 [Acidobacteriota bacterium]
MADVTRRFFAPPGDVVALTASEPLLFQLAERLWAKAPMSGAADVIEIAIERFEDFSGSARANRAAAPGSPRRNPLPFAFEERLRWAHETAAFRCEVPGVLRVEIDLARARIDARIAASLPSSSSSSSSLKSFLARTLLEAPAAVLLARRGWRALHAGAVSGPKGAVVLRGDAGAGKSTLVAAAHAAGFETLGDESLLVSRADPDELASSVRELTLLEDSAALLGLLSSTEAAFSGGEEKRRVDLFASSRPEARAARRASTVLLGPRDPGPARLVPLSRPQFLEEFARGEIPQEHVDGGAGAVAGAWAEAGGMRLDGTSDLPGGVALLKTLVT